MIGLTVSMSAPERGYWEATDRAIRWSTFRDRHVAEQMNVASTRERAVPFGSLPEDAKESA